MTADEAALLAAIAEHPTEVERWLILADWLDDRADPRGELVRLSHALRHSDAQPGRRSSASRRRAADEERVRTLLLAGVRACVPTLENSAGMRFAFVSPGQFWMGAPTREEGKWNGEEPRHLVHITRPFFLGITTVTREQYRTVTGSDPSDFQDHEDSDQFPANQISWSECVAFCRTLSARPEERSAGRMYRLPTEAEWEYACRGGGVSSTPFHVGDTFDHTNGWFHWKEPYRSGNSVEPPSRAGPVGQYLANSLGLHDMHGGIWEWCSDWYDANYYASSPDTDPTGPDAGRNKSLRGGGWNVNGEACRAARRARNSPDERSNIYGFRVVLDVPR